MKPYIRKQLESAGVEERGGGWWAMPDGRKVKGGANALRIVNGRARNTSERVNRVTFFRRAGKQYGDDRDIYTVAGYIPEGSLRYDHFWSYYERHPIAGRIVDMAPMTTWRNPPDVVQEEREESEFVDAFDGLADRLKLWHRLERADRLARIGRFGVLLIGAAGTDADLSREMTAMDGADAVKYLSAFPEGDVDIVEWVTDPTNPRFGLPEVYRIDLSSGVSNFKAGTVRVHWSRVVHIAEDRLADEVYGRPALRRVMNVLFDTEKVTAATGEAFWQLADRILQAKIDADAEIGGGDLDTLREALEEIQHDLRRQVTIQGGELSWLGGETPDPSGPADLFLTLFAVGAGIPKRILFGSETGERASTEDQKTWLGTVKERQERYAEPTILRALIDRLIERGGLPSPGAEGYIVQWPNLFETPEKDEADIGRIRAETAKNLTPVGGNPMDLVEVDEDGAVRLRPTGERGPLEADVLEPPEPEMPPGLGGPEDDEGEPEAEGEAA